MGEFTERMESLTEGIRLSREGRNAAVESILEGAKDTISEYSQRRRQMASELAGNLNSSRRSIAEAVHGLRAESQGLLKGVRRGRRKGGEEYREKLGMEISELRANVRNLLEKFETMRSEMGKELGNRAHELTGERKSDRQRVRGLTVDIIGRFRKELDELSSDIRMAKQVWMERRGDRAVGKPKPFSREEEGITDKERKEEPETREEMADREEGVILRLIEEHPEGIKLVDIGNTMGVNWRSLIRLVKSLEDAGKIEKIENLYYPAQG